MWRPRPNGMLEGWIDLVVELRGLLWRVGLVAFSAIATYTMLTRGYHG